MMLKAADGVDAAIDRNNPLWSAEQKDKIFKSNVFGYESGRVVDFESQEKARQELYISLNRMLPDYFKDTGFGYTDRINILKEIEKAFEQGLSDTTRPQNDTTLWEHSYAVASILKVLTVHKLLCNESLDSFEKVKFGILGIGWDGMRFLSYGQKIGDIVGRKNIIEDVKKKLKELIEHEYPIGNEIYADDDGIYFIVPAKLEGYENIWKTVERQIYDLASDISYGELQPSVHMESETQYMTRIVQVITELRKEMSFPFDSKKQFDIFRQSISDHWKGQAAKQYVRSAGSDRLQKKKKKTRKRKSARFVKREDLRGMIKESINRKTKKLFSLTRLWMVTKGLLSLLPVLV